MIYFFYFFIFYKVLELVGEGLLSTGPTPSSFLLIGQLISALKIYFSVVASPYKSKDSFTSTDKCSIKMKQKKAKHITLTTTKHIILCPSLSLFSASPSSQLQPPRAPPAQDKTFFLYIFFIIKKIYLPPLLAG